MVSQENIDQQHESKSYRVIIGAIVFIFFLLTFYALTKVAVRVQHARDNMWNRLTPVIIGIGILFVIILLFIFLFNIRSRIEEGKIKKEIEGKSKKH